MFLIILKSMLLGFLITLPTGPIGVLCLRKILQLGPLRGFIFGLSQTLALCIFGVLAASSLRGISELLITYQFWLRLIGGLVLIVFGVIIFFSKSSASTHKAISRKGLISDFFSILFLMLTNPPAWLTFLVVFSGLRLYGITSLFEHIEMICGILIGSVFSWALICLCFVGHRANSNQKVMTWINRSAGIFLAGFGIAICISALLN
jgi:threonine/homoserine/homoserine lactone efflux protein